VGEVEDAGRAVGDDQADARQGEDPSQGEARDRERREQAVADVVAIAQERGDQRDGPSDGEDTSSRPLGQRASADDHHRARDHEGVGQEGATDAAELIEHHEDELRCDPARRQ
jgi:hypothetical protein